MGSIPTANPSPPRRWPFSPRVVLLGLLALAGVAAVAIGVAVVWPDGAGGGPVWTKVARAEELAVNEPLAIDGEAYVVLLESGEVLALSKIDPHLGCTVAFRPGFVFEGRRGWFRNPCHGETYDLTGVCYFGPCPRGLDRYEVRVQDGDVEVNFAHLIEGPTHRQTDGREPVTLHWRGLISAKGLASGGGFR